MSRRLLDRGKAVVAPAELFTMLGCPYSRNRPEGTVRVGVANAERPDQDSETVVYLFRLGGIVFMQAGENHVPVGEWFPKAVASGFVPDVRMSAGQFQGARSAEAALS